MIRNNIRRQCLYLKHYGTLRIFDAIEYVKRVCNRDIITLPDGDQLVAVAARE